MKLFISPGAFNSPDAHYSLGHNEYQRFYYIRDLIRLDLISERYFKKGGRIKIGSRGIAKIWAYSLFFINSFLYIFKYKKRIKLIITERSIFSLLGLWGKIIGIKWIVDLWDSPYKEYYKSKGLIRFLRYMKCRITCIAMGYADSIIVSIHEKEYNKIIKNNKAFFFYNAIDPSVADHLGINKEKYFDFSDKILRFIYIGHDLDEYGMTDFLCRLKQEMQNLISLGYKYEFHHFGNAGQKTIIEFSNCNDVYFHGHVAFDSIKNALAKNKFICVNPLLPIYDLNYAYAVKFLEYYSSNNIIIYTPTIAINELISNLDQEGIFTIEKFFSIIRTQNSNLNIRIKRKLYNHINAYIKNKMISEIYNRVAKD